MMSREIEKLRLNRTGLTIKLAKPFHNNILNVIPRGVWGCADLTHSLYGIERLFSIYTQLKKSIFKNKFDKYKSKSYGGNIAEKKSTDSTNVKITQVQETVVITQLKIAKPFYLRRINIILYL